jgi:dephospho-CoA kinase
MYLVGLTGGIASGKSVVGRRFAELGAVLVDADVLAREVVEPGTQGLAEIGERFGSSVIAHPAIWRRAHELFDAAGAADPDAIVVYDVPLLAEASEKRPMVFDFIVVVDAPVDTRIRRMVELRGMSREDAERRVRAQATAAERGKLADSVIEGGDSIEHTLDQVDALWRQFVGRERGPADVGGAT